jgi:nitrite reductase (NADH) large subunit
MTVSGIVIVGGGIAGQAVCEAVRERDRDIPVTLVCGEPTLPYDRVRLSDLLVSDQDPSELVLRPTEWYEDRDVGVRLGSFVESADTSERVLVLDDGTELSYDRLVLATGSQPLLPSIPGIDLPGVRAFRGPEDCEAIRDAAGNGASRAAVIGGGLLGLEAARGVAAQGCPVTVVHLGERLMERQLDPGAAALLLPAMAELGVDVLLDRQTDAILGETRVEGLRFSDGEELAADLVVVSIGIRPETTLARSLGVACERGIVVDDHMETSLPGVLAVGECAEHRGVVYGLVAPIHDQAHVAARTLLERRNGGYAGTVASAKLKVMGVDLVAIGDAEGTAAAVMTDAGGRIYRKLVVRDGVATGAILLGDTRGAESLLESVRRGEAVDDPLARLVQAAEATAADLPLEAQVCNCNGVSKETIVAAVHEIGCTSTREVMACTRAGTGCGSCKSLVGEIVSAELGGAVEEPHYLCACRRQTREELAGIIREQGFDAVSDVAAACGTGHDCGACKPALAYLVSEVNHNLHREERDARFINDRVHANIQHDGTFSVVPRIYGGVVTPDELRRIADVADKYQVRMVKITGGQRIDLLGVRKEELPEVWRDLGMPSGHAYAKAVRTVKTCVGTEFCRYGIGDAVGLGIELEKEWEGLYTPAKVKGAVSGCPRNCAEASVKDIGVIAVEGGWEILVGGAAGGSVRKADLLVKVDTRREALLYSTIALQYYRENAEYRERWYDFVVRVGLDTVREIVLGADTGTELLERFRLAKAAVRDPWLERDDPYHPNQFKSELDAPALEAALPE